jgi:hypothetical protein
VYPGPTASCRDASCTAAVATVGATCNGSGLCPTLERVNCPGNCKGTGCGTDCATAAQCGFSEFCQAGRCVSQLPNGSSCASSGECASSYCVDGLCCDQACSGQCEACDLPDNPGTCSPVTGAPHSARPACVAIDAPCAGACDGTTRGACTYPGSAKICAAGKCVGDVATLAQVCAGDGSCAPVQEQLCTPYSCGTTTCAGNCTVDSNCPAAYYCSAGVCRPVAPLGAPCAAGDQCTLGFCVDGFCCDSPCDSECQACDGTFTGQCKPIAGPPHGGRAPCGGSGACGGSCDGTSPNGCAFPKATVSCGSLLCNGSVVVDAPTCNGVGDCIASTTTTDCTPFACAPDGTCLGTCATNDDCAPGLVCDGSSCVPAPPDAGARDAGTDAQAGAGGAAVPEAGTGGSGGVAGSGGTTGRRPDAGAAGGAKTRDGGAGAGAVDGGHGGSVNGRDQGTCGCRVPGRRGSDTTPVLGGLVLAALVARRRFVRRHGARRSV